MRSRASVRCRSCSRGRSRSLRLPCVTGPQSTKRALRACRGPPLTPHNRLHSVSCLACSKSAACAPSGAHCISGSMHADACWSLLDPSTRERMPGGRGVWGSERSGSAALVICTQQVCLGSWPCGLHHEQGACHDNTWLLGNMLACSTSIEVGTAWRRMPAAYLLEGRRCIWSCTHAGQALANAVSLETQRTHRS